MLFDCFVKTYLHLIIRRYGTKCGGCGQGLSPTDLVRKARDKVYHLRCFTCALCRRQLSTGEELYLLDDARFLCKEDFIRGKAAPGKQPFIYFSSNYWLMYVGITVHIRIILKLKWTSVDKVFSYALQVSKFPQHMVPTAGTWNFHFACVSIDTTVSLVFFYVSLPNNIDSVPSLRKC